MNYVYMFLQKPQMNYSLAGWAINMSMHGYV